MQFNDLNDFLKLSAVLNYQLIAKTVNWNSIVSTIVGKQAIIKEEREILLEVVEYLDKVYGHKKRRLGSLSIIHPLRATALLAQAIRKPILLDLITVLLHDRFEDIRPRQFEANNWKKFDTKFQLFLSRLLEQDRWFLMERLQWLTKRSEETYYHYIGRLLEQSQNTPEVIRVKLADRLDNTLDMRIDLDDPLQNEDFFETIFQLLFTKTYQGYQPYIPHPSASAINGAHRLYQLFKNIVLMSLVRQKQAARYDNTAKHLFEILARASMREAQRIALHIFGYHETAIKQLRDLMMDIMQYVQKGGIDSITIPDQGSRLDGLFMSRFDHPEKRIRNRNLDALYQDKPLMLEAAIAFIVIFLSFLNDPDFYVHGISTDGIHPESFKSG